MRGEFIRGDGAIIPNNVTVLGARLILAGGFQSVNRSFALGLTDAMYSPGLLPSALNEPTQGGYIRQALAANTTDWPVLGDVNNEPYIESKAVSFSATATWAKPVSRVALLGLVGGVTTLISLSTAFEPLVIDAATPPALRTFKYRLYLR